MSNEFHEEVPVELRLGRPTSAGEVNRVLRALGFKLNYDVYTLPRPGPRPHPAWQSDNVVEVELQNNDIEVDAQEPCDTIRLVYPLATIDSSMIDYFLKAVSEVRSALGGSLWLHGRGVSLQDIDAHLTECVSSLLRDWGEEPGSKELRVMIMESYSSEPR